MLLIPLKKMPDFFVLHPRFRQAYEFLETVHRNGIPKGRFSIDQDRLMAIVSSGKGPEGGHSPLEVHKKYIDIQYVIEGTDRMGWRPADLCYNISVPYSNQEDKALYHDTPSTYIDVQSDQCAIFFPDDAHAPMSGPGFVHKVILKVLI